MLKAAGGPVHREILYNDIYNWDNEPRPTYSGSALHNLRDKVGKSRIRTRFAGLATCWLPLRKLSEPDAFSAKSDDPLRQRLMLTIGVFCWCSS